MTSLTPASRAISWVLLAAKPWRENSCTAASTMRFAVPVELGTLETGIGLSFGLGEGVSLGDLKLDRVSS